MPSCESSSATSQPPPVRPYLLSRILPYRYPGASPSEPYSGTLLASPDAISRLCSYLARTAIHPTWQRSVRESLGISQWTLARRLGVSQNIISRWERYDYVPTLQTLLTWGDIITALEQESQKSQAQESKPQSKKADS